MHAIINDDVPGWALRCDARVCAAARMHPRGCHYYYLLTPPEHTLVTLSYPFHHASEITSSSPAGYFEEEGKT